MCVALECHACGAVATRKVRGSTLVPAGAPLHNTITTIGQYGQSQSGKRAVTFCFLLQQIDSPQLAPKIRSGALHGFGASITRATSGPGSG